MVMMMMVKGPPLGVSARVDDVLAHEDHVDDAEPGCRQLLEGKLVGEEAAQEIGDIAGHPLSEEDEGQTIY